MRKPRVDSPEVLRASSQRMKARWQLIRSSGRTRSSHGRKSYLGTPHPLELDWIGHWLTPHEFAAQMGRSYYWAVASERNGVLDSFGIPHMRDRRGRLWIQLVFDLS